jgi:hypothetical protein
MVLFLFGLKGTKTIQSFSVFLRRIRMIARIRKLILTVIHLVTGWSPFHMNREKEEIEEYDYAISCWIATANSLSSTPEAKAMYLNTAEELRIELDTGKRIYLNQRTS